MQLNDPAQTQGLIQAIEKRLSVPPVLVIFDTLARCTIGADENSAKDMGFIIYQADRIRVATGATVLLIHHTGTDTTRERGSTALRGALDTLISVTGKSSAITMKCVKAKDLPPFAPMTVALKTYMSSCVIQGGVVATKLNESALAPRQMQALQVLFAQFERESVQASMWEQSTGFASSTFNNVVGVLCDKGYVEKQPQGRNVLYQVTDSGITTLGPSSNLGPK